MIVRRDAAQAERLVKRGWQDVNRDLVICEKALGPDHPELALTLNNLAGFYREQGTYEEAEPLFRRAVAILEKTQSMNLALVPQHYAGLLREIDRIDEAAKLEAHAAQSRAKARQRERD